MRYRLLAISGHLDPSYNTLLHRLPWKSFSVYVGSGYEDLKDCPARILVKTILEDFSTVIENLDFTFRCSYLEFFRKIFGDRSFPRLKIVKVKDICSAQDSFIKFIKLLVSCAPNLQELHSDSYRWVAADNVLQGSSAVVVLPSIQPLYQRVHDSLIGVLRPKTMRICHHIKDDFDKELLFRYVPTVLEASRTSLTTLHADLLFAVPLMCYEICLENVKKFEIGMFSSYMKYIPQSILNLLKSFDFTRIFPKLNQVEIDNRHHRRMSPDHISGFVEQVNSALRLRNILPDRAINIKQLTIKNTYDTTGTWDSTLPLLSQMFPDVKKLSVQMHNPTEFSYQLLWEHFGDLEELDVKINAMWDLVIRNLDGIFCGIFPEEVAELWQKDDEYLKEVNIVPVMPSITGMRALRTLKIRFTTPLLIDHYRKCKQARPELIISKITGVIGFSRLSALAVTIENLGYKSEQDVNNLKPYASFVFLETKY